MRGVAIERGQERDDAAAEQHRRKTGQGRRIHDALRDCGCSIIARRHNVNLSKPRGVPQGLCW